MPKADFKLSGCVEMVGGDTRMDQFGSADKPANPLPIKCPHCTLPDFDFIAKPYLLAKGYASPVDTAPAEVGNFLVRERARKILELVAPGACTFHPTADMKTKKATPWLLAVPKRAVRMAEVEKKVPRCSKCGEPKVGWDWIQVKNPDNKGLDVFKTLDWSSRPETLEEELAKTNDHRKQSKLPPLTWRDYGLTEPPHPQRWTRVGLDREVYFSVRLEQLFKQAKVKGLVRLGFHEHVTTAPEDQEWVEQKMAMLAEKKLVDAATSSRKKGGSASRKWFEQYLKRNAAKKPARVDFTAIEKEHKITLPQDYKDFISIVGPKSFKNVNQTEGFTAKVLPPQKLDFKDYRKPKLAELADEYAKIDGVMFASTDHGDAFIFDVSAKGDYPVLWHNHEENTVEPFAPNFAECIKRFEEKN